MTRHRIFDITAIISTLGIHAWIVTTFFGGMFIYFLSYALFIIPIISLYCLSFGQTLLAIFKSGLKKNRLKVIFHTSVILAIIAMNLYQSELLKSKRILTATLKDDQFHYTLIFRDNGSCENEVSGIFSYWEVYHGKYRFSGDTIIFQRKPYDNDFIPDTLLIDNKAHAIFIGKDKEGKFSNTKEWLNHFEIQ